LLPSSDTSSEDKPTRTVPNSSTSSSDRLLVNLITYNLDFFTSKGKKWVLVTLNAYRLNIIFSTKTAE
jgi:hypothetical protein